MEVGPDCQNIEHKHPWKVSSYPRICSKCVDTTRAYLYAIQRQNRRFAWSHMSEPPSAVNTTSLVDVSDTRNPSHPLPLPFNASLTRKQIRTTEVQLPVFTHQWLFVTNLDPPTPSLSRGNTWMTSRLSWEVTVPITVITDAVALSLWTLCPFVPCFLSVGEVPATWMHITSLGGFWSLFDQKDCGISVVAYHTYAYWLPRPCALCSFLRLRLSYRDHNSDYVFIYLPVTHQLPAVPFLHTCLFLSSQKASRWLNALLSPIHFWSADQQQLLLFQVHDRASNNREVSVPFALTTLFLYTLPTSNWPCLFS